MPIRSPPATRPSRCNLLANDTDAEGDTLSVSAVDQATSDATTFTVDGTYGELVVTKATGAYTYTLNGNVIDFKEAAAAAALGRRRHAAGPASPIPRPTSGTLGTDAHPTADVHRGGAAATSGSAAVTLGPADFNFDGHTYATGPVATANIGNGSDDGVTLVGSVNWNGGGDAGHVQVILYNGNPSVSGSGLFGEATANGLDLQILAGGNAILDTGVTLASGQWHNVALTHENGTFTLYVDGAVAYTGDAGANGIPNPSYPNEPEAMFVAGDGGENFNGAVANVSVWNTALTQAQVQGTDFNALTGSESGLVAYYPLNDGSGTTVADAINSAGNLQISNDGQGSGSWTSATGDTTLTISADNQQHEVFPFLNITGTGPTIQSAIVTWNITGDGTVSSEGVDVGGNPYGITITFDPNAGGPGVAGYRLVGSATVADYENVLSHLTFQTSQGQSGTTFTVTVNDGTGYTATETSTLNVFGINEGPQTASVADGGNWYATGQLTVSNPGTGDTWSIAGGHNYTASSNYHFGIDEFSVVNTDGGTPTTIFDDSFNGIGVPPAGSPPSRMPPRRRVSAIATSATAPMCRARARRCSRAAMRAMSAPRSGPAPTMANPSSASLRRLLGSRNQLHNDDRSHRRPARRSQSLHRRRTVRPDHAAARHCYPLRNPAVRSELRRGQSGQRPAGNGNHRPRYFQKRQQPGCRGTHRVQFRDRNLDRPSIDHHQSTRTATTRYCCRCRTTRRTTA